MVLCYEKFVNILDNFSTFMTSFAHIDYFLFCIGGCEVLKHPRLQGETEDLPDGFPSPLTNLQDGQKIFTEGATLR